MKLIFGVYMWKVEKLPGFLIKFNKGRVNQGLMKLNFSLKMPKNWHQFRFKGKNKSEHDEKALFWVSQQNLELSFNP